MYLNSDYIAPADLTGYVREAMFDYQINQFQLSRWLPNRTIDDIEYRFVSGGEGLLEAASFRSYDAESQIGERPGIIRTSGELPPISRKIRLGEYDRLRMRQDPGVAIQTGIENDAVRMSRNVASRLELARGDALVNGSVTINENGLQAFVDFGRASSQEVTAPTVWDDPSADPINDLITWVQAQVLLNGEAPGVMVFGRRVLVALSKNPALRNLAATVIGAPAILSQDHITQTLTAFGLPDFTVYDARVNVNHVGKRIIPDNVVLLLPEDVAQDDWEGTQLGATFWGTTAEALEPGYGIDAVEAPGIVAGAYSSEDPVGIWTKAAAIGLPVLANPNLSFAATVLSSDGL